MNSRILLLAFTVISLALPASAFGKAQPDLLVKRLSDPPASLKPGDQVKVQLTVANKGAKTGQSAVRLYLSKDAKVGGDIALTGSPRAKSLKKGASAKVSARATVPAKAEAGKYFLLACADGAGKLREKNEKNNCRASAKSVQIGVPGGAGQQPADGAQPSSNGPLGSPSQNPTQIPAGTVHGRVLYSKRDCYRGPSAKTALTNATVKLVPSSGAPIVTTTDGAGEFEAQLASATGVQAYAVLDGSYIAVGPDASPYTPYEIRLGEFTSQSQDFVIGGGDGNTQVDPASGAANIYSVLDRGARVAAAASPVAIPKVRARWRYNIDLASWLGDDRGSAYDPASEQIWVGGTLFNGSRDEYEAFPLLHEYGHHVLKHVANPPGATGEHSFASVHVAHPELAWSEGFANGFAAVAEDDAQLTLGCDVRMNVGAKPATARLGADEPLRVLPEGSQGHLAQYNETAIAGSLWSVSEALGNGDRAAGFKAYLGALKSFADAYHAPRDMREVRDAISEFADNADRDRQQKIGDAFDDHRLRWGFNAYEISQVKNGRGSGWVVPWVYGSFCDMGNPGAISPSNRADERWFVGPAGTSGTGVLNHYGGIEVRGPLGYTHHDDCWETIRGAWLADPSAQILYSHTSTLPWLANQAHRQGKVKIGLVYLCPSGPDICAGSSRDVTVKIGTGVWHRPGPDKYLEANEPLNAKTVTVNVPQVDARAATITDVVPVAEIDALGYCRIVNGPLQDCSS